MPLDPNIFFQYQPADPFGSIARGVQQGMSMNDMMQRQKLQSMQGQQIQRQMADDQAMRSAFKDNMVMSPDGTSTVNTMGMMSTLGKGGNLGTAAVKEIGDITKQQREMEAARLDAFRKGAEAQGQILSAVKAAPADQKQAAWERAIDTIERLKPGSRNSFPKIYDEGTLNYHLGMSMSAKDQAEQIAKLRGLDIQQQNANANTKRANAETRKADAMMGQRQDDRVNKMAAAFQKDMDPDASRTGNFGQVSGKVLAGQRLLTLINSSEGGNLPPAQMEELSLGFANMLANTNGAARAQVEALVPDTAMGDAQKFKAWFMNEPYGANQQKFVALMKHGIEREMDTANQQLNDIRVRRLGAHELYRRAAPEQWAAQMKNYGLDPANYDPKTLRYKAPAAAPTGGDSGTKVFKTNEIQWAD